MAPPKRKTTGRVTAKGTKPGQAGAMAREAAHHESSVGQSARYTPPTPKEFYESPKWVPILMFTFIGLGVVSILTRYVVPSFENTNTPVLVGLVLMMAGLFTATKWR
ncbi:MAG: cell division protein CrgA [Ilumatobacteraceae bacterium]